MPHLRPNKPPDYRSGWGSGGWGVHRASLPPSHGTFLEEARVRFRLGSGTEVGAAERGDRAAAGRPLDEAELQEVRLVHVLDRVRLLAERRREGAEPDRATAVLLRDRPQELAVEPLEPNLVDLEQFQRLPRDGGRDGALMPHLRDVPDAAEDPVAHARRPAGAAGDLAVLVVVEPERDPEAVAQR